MASQDFVVGNVVGMDFLVLGKNSFTSVAFGDSVVEIGSEREFMILVCVQRLLN